MNSTVKKVLNISLKVLVWALVAFTIGMMIFTIISVTTVDERDRGLFGFRFYIVKTDSMSRSELNKDMEVHFNAGDIVIAKKVKEGEKLEIGDVITFVSANEDSWGENITHMICEVWEEPDGELIGYKTYGTNKGQKDEALVLPEYVLGEYVGKLPKAGHFFAFVKSTPGYIICILVPFLLLILYNGMNVVRLFRKYKREQMEAMQAEKDKLEAERAENQRMMQELLALKAQLDQKNGGEGTPPAEPASEVTPTEEAKTDETAETKSEDAAPAETTDENQ